MTAPRSLLFLLAVVPLLAPTVVRAQTCGPSTPFPQCDGLCPPGLVCADASGLCDCLPEGSFLPCGDPGNPFGSPQCYGGCPPSMPICSATGGGNCICVVPTLSQWGILGMVLAMFCGVLRARSRLQSRLSRIGSA